MITGSARAATDDGDQSHAQPHVAATASSSAAYFGLQPPTESPERFAPEIISLSGRSISRLAFSPDGTECAFTVFEGVYSNNRLWYTRVENGAWKPPILAPVVEDRETLEPLFSRDSRRLYFGVKSADGSLNVDFWSAERTEQGWSKPQPLPVPLNSPQNEFCVSQTADGTMYFASKREGGRGGLDLYRAVASPGAAWRVDNLGTPVNSEFDDGDPALSPDGRTLVFYSATNRLSGTGSSDLFISFADAQGGWSKPVSLGKDFNTPVAEYAPTFSQDGQMLFFARFDGNKGEAYWVSARSLERFRTAASIADAPPLAQPDRTPISVAPEILRRHVGTYVLKAPPGLINHITFEGDQLMTQLAGQPKVPMFAAGENKFFLKVAEVDLEFVTNESGETTDLIIRQNGMELRMTRNPELGASELDKPI